MRHIVTKTAQTILFAGIALFTFCTSSLADIDWKRMKRDLSIQESILDQFFDEKKVSTTGLYIENHGVLLIASGGIKYGEINRLQVQVIRKGESSDIATPAKSARGVGRIGDKSSENEEEVIFKFSMFAKKPEASKSQNEAIEKQIAEFLGLYANAIGQLKEDDRVTVLLNSSERDFHSFLSPSIEFIASIQSDSIRIKKHVMETFKKSENFKNLAFKITRVLLEATVTKRDIEAYNRGKIDEQTFRDRITFREHEPERVRSNSIDMMADILTNTLKKDTDLHFLSGTKSTGLYQKGIGALFLVSQKADPLHLETKNTDAFKAEVLATLAYYSATLRGLSSEESIIVHTNLIGQSHFKIGHKDKTTDTKPPDRILFRIAKRDIEAYASQKIDLDTLKKRVVVTEM